MSRKSGRWRCAPQGAAAVSGVCVGERRPSGCRALARRCVTRKVVIYSRAG